MKKIYFLFCLMFCFSVNSQIVNIPDPVFKAKLLSASPSQGIASTNTPFYNSTNNNWTVSTYHKIDTNNDGEIQVSEAQAIKYLNVYKMLYSSSINDLTGIEAFTNLIYLNCRSNDLNTLDLSQNTALKFLYCDHNQLSNLNVTQCSMLIDLNCSYNQLSNLDVSQCLSLNELNFSYNQLTNFDSSTSTVLTTLYCYNNQLTNLNVSQNVALNNLHCFNNQLASLNVSQNTQLNELYCGYNLLTSLDITQNSLLTNLMCYNNQLTGLDVTQNTMLTNLLCNNNQLTSLDVTQNTLLQNLTCYNNQIASLDVTQNTALLSLRCRVLSGSLDVTQNTLLTLLSCSHSQLTSLDVSQNLELQTLDCSVNNLTSLDVSLNENLENLYCNNNQLSTIFAKNNNSNWVNLIFSNNPNIQYVCIDDEDVDLVQQNINAYGYTNCHVNSYCSFVPGGNFYQITGNTKWDFENNGCDFNDNDYPNLKFNITDGNVSGTFIDDISGDYNISLQAGNYTITPVLENPTCFNISPASFTVDFPSQASPFTQDFCVTPSGVHSDVEIILIPTSVARPGFDSHYSLIYRNIGNQVENGEFTFKYSDDVLDYVSSSIIFDSQAFYGTETTLHWNYSNLLPFETRTIDVVLNVNSPTETPAVNNGDVLGIFSEISATNTDVDLSNNSSSLRQVVVGSYDPNDKTCIEGESVDISMVGEYVHYVIRFENTGTYPAENIVVKDMIDISKFDISTLVPLHGSHEFYTRIKDNKVEFIFENINLDFNDATNDGYVAFKIKTLPTLTVGDTFSNDANIYFDYNFPITTNTYTTTIDNLLNNQGFAFEKEFVLYPNPSKDIVNISSKNQTEIQSVEIYNMVGQIVIAIPNTTKTIDVSALKTGPYFIKVNTEQGNTTMKFVKE